MRCVVYRRFSTNSWSVEQRHEAIPQNKLQRDKYVVTCVTGLAFFLLTSPLKQTSSHLPGLPFSVPVSSQCTHLCVITSLKKKKEKSAGKLRMFKPILLTSLTGIYWFPCPRSHVQTAFLHSQSCLFVFISHLATQSSRELSQTIATYLHFYCVVEVFPATQTPLSFHPVAIITKAEKGLSPRLSPLGEAGKVAARCFSLFSLSD